MAGAILVFDITDLQSFKDVQSWLKEISEYGNENISIILVGNKSDLKDK